MATGPDWSQLTTEALKRESGVTDEQLARSVDKTVLKKLAGMFDCWEKYVESPGLDLKPGQIADVRRHCYEHGNEMAMYRALELWQKKNPYFTYQSLLEVLLELREGSLADQVCTVIVSEYQSRQQLEQETSPISLPSPVTVAQASMSALEVSTATRVPNQSADTAMEIANQNEYMEITTDKGSSLVAGHVKKFESRFITLRKSALNEITAKGVSVREFRQTLMTLPSSISGQNEDFIMTKYSLFKQAESIEDIFLHLNFYLSYIDFSLLEHIIDQFCSESLNKEMTQYAKDMRQFRSETTIEEVLPHLPEAPKSPKDYSKLEVKVNFDVSTATLEEIDQFRKTFAKSFQLSELLLYLSSLKKSSLLVTWLVPAYLGEELKQIIREKEFSFFLKIDVLKLSLNGECLYPPRAEAQASGASSTEGQVTSETMLKGTKRQEVDQPIKSSQPRSVKQEIVDRINHRISSTYNCRGLVIQSGLVDYSLEILFQHRLNYAVETTTDLSDTLNAVARHVDLPKHYPIVVLVERDAVDEVMDDRLHIRCQDNVSISQDNVSISQDIIEPLLPPNAPELAINPKIFLIFSDCTMHYDWNSSPELNLPSEGNFIVFYVHARSGRLEYLYHILYKCLEEPFDIERNLVSTQEYVNYQRHHLKSTVISQLTAPVFLHCDPPQQLEADPTSSASKEAQPLFQQTITATQSNKKSVLSDKESD